MRYQQFRGILQGCRLRLRLYNTTADASQIRMTRGLRTTYITREKFAVTLYWFQDYRDSPMVAHDFVDEMMTTRWRKRTKEAGGSRFGWKRVENDGNGDGKWEILYSRNRNCDLPSAISAEISIRVRNVNTVNREMCIIICCENRLRKRSSASVTDCLFFVTSITQYKISMMHLYIYIYTLLIWINLKLKKKTDESNIFPITPFPYF